MNALTFLSSLLIAFLSNNSSVVFEFCEFKAINFGTTGFFASQGDAVDLIFEFKNSSFIQTSQSFSGNKLFAINSAYMQILFKDSKFELNEICKNFINLKTKFS